MKINLNQHHYNVDGLGLTITMLNCFHQVLVFEDFIVSSMFCEGYAADCIGGRFYAAEQRLKQDDEFECYKLMLKDYDLWTDD